MTATGRWAPVVKRPKMFRSLRVRMALSHAAVLALILLVLGGAGDMLLARQLNRAASASVMNAAEIEADRITETGRVTAPADNDVPSSSAIRIALFLPDGGALGERDEVPAWLHPQSVRLTTIRAVGEDVRLVTIPVVVQGHPLATVVAGRSLAPEHRLLDRVRLLLALGGLVGLVGSLVAGWVLAGRAVRPIRRAYEAQATFAADASHEFRTPLAFIRSAAEVMAQRDPELGGDVLGEVEYLTHLTGRLLELARAEWGAVRPPLGPVDVMETCREAVRRSERALGVRVQLPPPEPVFATADPLAMQAALDALLENVARHGGGEATISLRRRGGRVVVRVVDHGPGMSPDHLESAFERFYRADPSRSREGGGAGLGLAVARSLIQAQMGRLWLEPTPGGGLTAAIELHVASAGPSASTPATPLSVLSGPPSA